MLPLPPIATIRWSCPVCRAYYPLPAYWAHLEEAHGITRRMLTRARPIELVRQEATLHLLDLIDASWGQPGEHVPSRIRHAARHLRSLMPDPPQKELTHE